MCDLVVFTIPRKVGCHGLCENDDHRRGTQQILPARRRHRGQPAPTLPRDGEGKAGAVEDSPNCSQNVPARSHTSVTCPRIQRPPAVTSGQRRFFGGNPVRRPTAAANRWSPNRQPAGLPRERPPPPPNGPGFPTDSVRRDPVVSRTAGDRSARQRRSRPDMRSHSSHPGVTAPRAPARRRTPRRGPGSTTARQFPVPSPAARCAGALPESPGQAAGPCPVSPGRPSRP